MAKMWTKFTLKKYHHFFNNVMLNLGYHDWELNIKSGHDSYCWINSKRIDIGLDYDGNLKQIILHEIAHIGTARFCNQKHNKQFWDHLSELTFKWLKTDLDNHQKFHKKYSTTGSHSIKYWNKSLC